MKGNAHKLTVLLTLFLSVSLLLTGALTACTKEDRQAPMTTTAAPVTDVPEKPLVPLKPMEQRFADMSVIDAQNSRITVISKDYLDSYWQDYKEGEIRSLTAEEVLYLIEDSVRLYHTYKTVVLEPYTPPINLEDAKGIPVGTYSDKLYKQIHGSMQRLYFDKYPDGVIQTYVDYPAVNDDDEQEAVHAIILYRIAMLSSPEVFVSSGEAMLYVGDDPGKYSSYVGSTICYIPGFSSETDRTSVLVQLGAGADAVADPEKLVDYFCLTVRRAGMMKANSKDGTQTNLYPTAEQQAAWEADVDYVFVNESEPKDYTLTLHEQDNRFTLTYTGEKPDTITGTYVMHLNSIELRMVIPETGDDSKLYTYMLYRTFDGGYYYSLAHSLIPPVFHLPDTTTFYQVPAA